MLLWSNSWTSGDPIPPRFAAGAINADGIGFSDNRNPHLAWSDLPEGTQSLVLVMHDFDAPSDRSLVNRDDAEVPPEADRQDFFHWVLVDLPASRTAIEEGEFSQGFTARGKPGPASLHGARQGLNDYTAWFAGDAEHEGQYHGYDGPFPPYNDGLVHHYLFTLYAVSVPHLALPDGFTGHDVREALVGHVLDTATFSGIYSLNRLLVAA